METIIDPISPSEIERELTTERLLCKTNKGGNLIYVVDAHCAPQTMREIGRLREISFRAAGGGTGKTCDIDRFDLMPHPCQQIIVWDPNEHIIIGAYRFLLGQDMVLRPDGQPDIAMAHMFHFSEQFVQNTLPHTIELGRSFVRPEYQSSKAGARALYALDNLWDGIGAVIVRYPHISHLMGKMTMYPSYNRECRNMLLCLLHLYFGYEQPQVWPINPLPLGVPLHQLRTYFVGNDFKEDYRRLNHYVRERGINIPPLVNSYMNLSPSMRLLGTSINDEFGNVEETGIIVTISDIVPSKRERYIDRLRNPKEDVS